MVRIKNVLFLKLQYSQIMENLKILSCLKNEFFPYRINENCL